MASKQLVLAIFPSEAEADTAAAALKQWDHDEHDIKLHNRHVLRQIANA